MWVVNLKPNIVGLLWLKLQDIIYSWQQCEGGVHSVGVSVGDSAGLDAVE